MSFGVKLSLPVALGAGLALAGDYALKIDDRLTTPCQREVTHSNNTCTTEAVIADLRSHHILGKAPEVVAVTVSLRHCAVGFASRKERVALADGLATLLAERDVTNEEGLLHSVGCFPFSWMRSAIEKQLSHGGHLAKATARLEKAKGLVASRDGG